MTLNTAFDLIGLVGSFIISVGLVPQVVKVYETKSAIDFSYSFLAMYSSGLGLTVLYGIGENLWPIYIPCSMEFLGALLLLVMKLVYDKNPIIVTTDEKGERHHLLANAVAPRAPCTTCNFGPSSFCMNKKDDYLFNPIEISDLHSLPIAASFTRQPSPRIERLDPWIRALNSCVLLPARSLPSEVDAAQETGVVYLHWTMLPPPNGEAFPEEAALACEALELLALLSIVDYDEWYNVISQLWPHAFERWVRILYPTRFELGVVFFVAHTGELACWAKCAWERTVSPAGEYATLRRELEDERTISASVRVQVFVVGDDDNVDGDDDDDGDEDGDEDGHEDGYDDGDGDEDGDEDGHEDGDEDGHEDGDGDEGGDEDGDGGGDDSRLLEIMELAQAHVQRTVDVERQQHLMPLLWLVSLEGDVLDDEGFPDPLVENLAKSGVCVEACSTIREISVESGWGAEQNGGVRLMQWLALCAFGRYGSPRLDTLSLSLTDLQLSDIRALEQALLNDDAFSALFHRLSDVNETTSTVANASSFALTRPRATTQDSSIVSFEYAIEDLLVLALEGEYVCALLPGWGEAWVPRADVKLDQRSADAALMKRKRLPVRRLIFNDLPESSLPKLLDLLRVVGFGVKVITISWAQNIPASSNDWIRDVCSACPDLDDLCLDVADFGSLEDLAACYSDGVCRAQRLLVHVLRVGSDALGECLLFHWLADRHHGMPLHLRDLTLSVHSGEDIDPRLVRLVSAAPNMLEYNHWLWNLDLTVNLRSDVPTARLDVVQSTVELYDSGDVTGRLAPLPIEKKLAFLSILREPSRSGRSKIDVFVVAQIFEFAAQCKKRRVDFTVESRW